MKKRLEEHVWTSFFSCQTMLTEIDDPIFYGYDGRKFTKNKYKV